MDETEAVRAALLMLNQHGVSHAISGSLASSAYGELRSTRDADIVVELEWDDLADLFDDLEPEFEIDRQLRFESLTETSRFVLRHRTCRFVIEFFLSSDDAFDRSRFSRRIPENYLGVPTFLFSPEDVILQKAVWSRRSGYYQHREDIAGVLRVQSNRLDWTCINHWADQHGTRALLHEIREEVERSRPPCDCA